jgi:hypothetical protein
MSFKSDFAKTTTLTTFLQEGSYSSGPIYLALFTTMPDPEDGTGGVEVSTSGTGYSRVLFPYSSQYEGNNPQDGTFFFNDGTIFFGPRTGGSWGTVLGWGIVDTASGAYTLLYSGDFSTSFSPPTDQGILFNSASISIAER